MTILQAYAFPHPLFILLISLLAYLVIPGIGAFMVRKRWRTFRRSFLEVATFPLPDYPDLRNGRSGYYRFYGTIGALEEEGIVWIDNERISLKVDLKKHPIYMMVSSGEGEQLMPEILSWKNIQTLPEGTKIHVAGFLDISKEGAVFRSTQEQKLLIALYDGPTEQVLFQAIRSGRERNEYWNNLTPVSLTAGSFILFIYFYLLLGSPMLRFPAILSLTMSLLPVSPFLPPATLGYSLYRNLWGRARSYRAKRDLLRLSSLAEGAPADGDMIFKKYESRKAAERDNPEAITIDLEGYSGEVLLVGESRRSPSPSLPRLILPPQPNRLAVKREREAIRLEIISLGVLSISTFGELLFLFALFAAIIR
jgi:hypothetical protein